MKATTREMVKTAYHEAGHAVISLAVGRPVRFITIVPDTAGRLGLCCGYPIRVPPDLVPTARLAPRAEREVLTLLAGDIAERRYSARVKRVAADGDRHAAIDWALAVSYGRVDEAEAYIGWLTVKCGHMVTGYWSTIVLVASELACRGRMTGKDVRQCFTDLDARRCSLEDANS